MTDVLERFKEWTGGFEPWECDPEQVAQYGREYRLGVDEEGVLWNNHHGALETPDGQDLGPPSEAPK